MTRDVRASRGLLAYATQLSPVEAAEVAEILELLREVDDLASLSDYAELHAPSVVHTTLGETVAVSWRSDPGGVLVVNFDRYRPPPADLP